MFEQELLPSLQTARSRYLNTLSNLKADELPLKLAPESNSIGFLIRHIAEVEFRFCTMFLRVRFLIISPLWPRLVQSRTKAILLI